MKHAGNRVQSAFALALAAILLMASTGWVAAARISDVRGTKHNLSAVPDALTYTYIDPATRAPATGTVPPRTVKASTETQVCVFCHTPHGATPGVTPLWNRQLSTQTYTPYTSATLDANVIEGQLQQPGGTSKLCLSCHDGSLAIGNVNVLNGTGSATTQGTVAIDMQGTGAGGTMPGGTFGEISGFTRKIGIDLRNDHPISLTFTDQLAVRDGELRRLTPDQRYPADGSVIGVRAPGGVKPKLPLERTGPGNQGQVQCGTCHDPHLRETDLAQGNQKFLRQSRFQTVDPATTLATTYSPEQDIICIGCHEKNVTPGVWAYSAHANPLVADEIYKVAAAQVREFPDNTRVWQAACLNCHDTHTVQGARRLLREGTDSVGSPKQGGNSAIEETCYQCHTLAGDSVLNTSAQVPNIRTDFQSARRMPITNADQGGTEVHEISASFNDPGFIDCSKFDGRRLRRRLPGIAQSTGAAPCRMHRLPQPAPGAEVPVRRARRTRRRTGKGRHPSPRGRRRIRTQQSHLRRTARRFRGGTDLRQCLLPDAAEQFHRQARRSRNDDGDPRQRQPEHLQLRHPRIPDLPQVPLQLRLQRRQHLSQQPGAAPAWHQRRPDAFRAGQRWANPHQLHQSGQGVPGALGPSRRCSRRQRPRRRSGDRLQHQQPPQLAPGDEFDRPHLPRRRRHGDDFPGALEQCRRPGQSDHVLLRLPRFRHHPRRRGRNGDAYRQHQCQRGRQPVGAPRLGQQLPVEGRLEHPDRHRDSSANGVCFKCHNYASYATRSDNRTGFFTDKGDGHTLHADKIGRMRCSWCHVAVPHGWKNKALLVNLNDVGPEVGLAPGTQVRNNTSAGYTNGPYYMNAMNKIRSFARSGQWTETNCGSAGAPGNGQSGRDWMRDSNENCENPP